MLTMNSASAGATAALLLAVLAAPSAAQYGAGARAPIIRVYSQNGPNVESNYVTPAIQVSEDVYVFAVSMDLDGQIQILHPDYPGISVRIRHQQQLRLPNFFAGYRQPAAGRLDAHLSRADYPVQGAVVPEIREIGPESAETLGRELEVEGLGQAEERHLKLGRERVEVRKRPVGHATLLEPAGKLAGCEDPVCGERDAEVGVAVARVDDLAAARKVGA
jgi:hypothetical protein